MNSAVGLTEGKSLRCAFPTFQDFRSSRIFCLEIKSWLLATACWPLPSDSKWGSIQSIQFGEIPLRWFGSENFSFSFKMNSRISQVLTGKFVGSFRSKISSVHINAEPRHLRVFVWWICLQFHVCLWCHQLAPAPSSSNEILLFRRFRRLGACAPKLPPESLEHPFNGFSEALETLFYSFQDLAPKNVAHSGEQ